MVTPSPCCLRVCCVLSRVDLSWAQADLTGSDGGSLQTTRTQIRDQLQAAEVLRSERVSTTVESFPPKNLPARIYWIA